MKSAIIREERRLIGFEPDHLAEIVRGGRFEHYILSRSECSVRHRRLVCGTFSVDVGHYSFATRVCGAFPANRVCIGYMRSMSRPSWINGFDIPLDAIQYYAKNTEINYRAAPNGEWVLIELSESSLQRKAMELLGRTLPLPSSGATNLSVPLGSRLSLDRMIQRAMHDSVPAAAIIEPIKGALVELLDHALSDTLEILSQRWRHREDLLHRADQYLRANAGEVFDCKSLAAAVGTTERCIQLHFAEAYGMAPGHWARCLSLHRVRERLTHARARNVTLESIARDFGFRHMGRFSAYYAELFGELPSATARH